jgi:hypothetical protein
MTDFLHQYFIMLTYTDVLRPGVVTYTTARHYVWPIRIPQTSIRLPALAPQAIGVRTPPPVTTRSFVWHTVTTPVVRGQETHY